MKARGVVLGVAVAVLALGAWALWPGRAAHVTVAVTNATAREVEWVTLEHERGGERIDYLAPHESKTIRFAAGGENAFTLRARFADGAEVRSDGHYVEAGYAFHASIRDTGIVMSPPEVGY